MDEIQFNEICTALWRHVQAANVLHGNVGLPLHIIDQINCITGRKLEDLKNGLLIMPPLKSKAE
jgi:hypothetical protein